MDKLTLFPIIFQSIPEAISLIGTSLILLGYNLHDNFKKVLILGILNSLFVVILRYYWPFGFHTLFGLIFLIISLSIGIKIELIKSLIIGIFGIILLGILESIFIPLLLFLFNLSMDNVLEDQFSRTFIAYPHIIVLTTLGALAQKKAWHLINLNTMLISKKTIVLFIVVLFQAFFIMFFNITVVFDQAKLLISTINQFSFVINVLLAASLIVTVILIKRLFHMAENEAIMIAQESYTKNVDDLFTSYRAQRHDFHNHLQTIYNMVHSCENTEAKEYLDFVLDDFEDLNELIRLKHSAVAALLKAKLAVANSKNISFEINAQSALDDIKVKPHELVNILGNLIDNAIEAVENLEEKSKQISLELSRFKTFIMFKISNPGTIASKDDPEKIFEKNFTTKDRSKHDGLGLTTVKNLILKNKGEIVISSTEETGAEVTVILPT